MRSVSEPDQRAGPPPRRCDWRHHTMAHAGTMVGGSAQTKQGGSLLPAMALAVAVVIATIAGVWLASSASRVGSAKPAADRSYDQIEAQRGAITLAGGSSQAYAEKLNGILDGAHAAPYAAAAVTLTGDDSRTHNEKFLLFDRAHAAPFAGPAVTPLPSATSGTFHPGKVADDQVMTQPKRDRVG